jgi:hypothetical protein
MKSCHLLIAALLVLPVFFSCGGKDEPEKPSPNTPSNPSNPNTPSNPDTPSNPSTPTDPPAEPELEIRRTFRFDNNIISTNGSGDYVAVLGKAGNGHDIHTGSFYYDKSTKTFTYTNLGKIEVLDGQKVAFTPTGGSRKEYNASVTEIVSDQNAVANRMNGTWIIEETILDYRGGNYTFTGMDLNEVEAKAREAGYEFTAHLDPGMVITKIIVTDSMMGAAFQNGQSYAAEHSLRQGSEFNFSEFTKDLKGTASIQFKEDKCFITVDTTVDEFAAHLIVRLRAKS